MLLAPPVGAQWGHAAALSARPPRQLVGMAAADTARPSSFSTVGPRSLKEWFAWPLQLCDTLIEADQRGTLPGALRRAVTRLQEGVQVISHYTGQGSFEQAADFIHTAFSRQGLLNSNVAQPGGFLFQQACDIQPAVQRVIASFHERVLPDHIFWRHC